MAIAGLFCQNITLPALARLVNICNSPYTQYVLQVDVGYGPLSYKTEEAMSYAEDLTALLSYCLNRLPNLKSLNFCGPPLMCLPHEILKSSIDTVLRLLCYMPPRHLTELELQLPMANDFAPLFAGRHSTLPIPIGQTLKLLRHLGLHIYAQTNQNAHATHILRIIELSISLTSLSISGTNDLSLDSLKLGPGVRLQYLFLANVSISSHGILNLIEQFKDSIESIELQSIRIGSGSCDKVISSLRNLSGLHNFDVSQGRRLGYKYRRYSS